MLHTLESQIERAWDNHDMEAPSSYFMTIRAVEASKAMRLSPT